MKKICIGSFMLICCLLFSGCCSLGITPKKVSIKPNITGIDIKTGAIGVVSIPFDVDLTCCPSKSDKQKAEEAKKQVREQLDQLNNTFITCNSNIEISTKNVQKYQDEINKCDSIIASGKQQERKKAEKEKKQWLKKIEIENTNITNYNKQKNDGKKSFESFVEATAKAIQLFLTCNANLKETLKIVNPKFTNKENTEKFKQMIENFKKIKE